MTQLCSMCKLPVLIKQAAPGSTVYVHCRHCDESRCPKCMDTNSNCTICTSPELRQYNGIGPGAIPPPEPKGLFRR